MLVFLVPTVDTDTHCYMPCVQTTLPFEQPFGDTDLKYQINLHDQTNASAHQQGTAHLQEQVSALEDEKVQC